MNSFSFFVAAAATCVLLFAGADVLARTETDPAIATAEPTRLRLFSFEGRSPIADWRAVNDSVMGGLSTGELMRDSRGKAVFEGDVSLENRGGFSSVRADIGTRDLEGYDGIIVRVRGDGKMYTLLAKTNRTDNGYRFQRTFKTEADTWQEIKIPLADFKPYYRGMRLFLWDDLDDHELQSIGFMIAGEQEGPFRLEIDWIDVYRDPKE